MSAGTYRSRCRSVIRNFLGPSSHLPARQGRHEQKLWSTLHPLGWSSTGHVWKLGKRSRTPRFWSTGQLSLQQLYNNFLLLSFNYEFLSAFEMKVQHGNILKLMQLFFPIVILKCISKKMSSMSQIVKLIKPVFTFVMNNLI
jgi:hypothetical protein